MHSTAEVERKPYFIFIFQMLTFYLITQIIYMYLHSLINKQGKQNNFNHPADYDYRRHCDN